VSDQFAVNCNFCICHKSK